VSKPKKIKWVSNWILRILLGLVFFTAAYMKIRDPYPFWEFIERLLRISPVWATPALWGIVAFETGLGLSLFLFHRSIAPVLVSITVFIVFSAILGYAIHVSLGINCGCFGSMFSRDTNGALSLIRNGVLIFVSLCLLWLNKNPLNTTGTG
jgi:uncharacterized membrane protein YphA (DoxX/SURF4 family)